MPDVFVSYSRFDADFGRKLHTILTQEKRDVWMDWEDIPLTADFWAEIKQGIETSDNFVLIMSPDSIGSPICQMEIDHAIAMKKRIIPIFYRDPQHEAAFTNAQKRAESDDYVRKMLDGRDVLKMSNVNWLTLAGLNWVFFTEAEDFATKYTELKAALDLDLNHVRQHTRLLTRALEWESSKRNANKLLVGTEVDEAEKWLNNSLNKSPEPASLHREYIQAGLQTEAIRQANRRRVRLQRQFIIGQMLLLLLTFAILAVLTFSIVSRFNDDVIDLELQRLGEMSAHDVFMIEENLFNMTDLVLNYEENDISTALQNRWLDDLESLTKPLFDVSNTLEFVLFFDTTGTIILELNPDGIAPQWSAQHPDFNTLPEVQAILSNEDAVTTIVQDRNGEYGLFSLGSILGENNRIIGGIGLGLSAQDIIDEQASDQNLGAGSFFQVTWFAPDGDIAATSFPEGSSGIQALFEQGSLQAAREYQATNSLSRRDTASDSRSSYDVLFVPFGDYGIGFVGVSATTAFADPVTRNILIAIVVAFIIVTIGFIGLNWLGLWLGRQQDMQ